MSFQRADRPPRKTRPRRKSAEISKRAVAIEKERMKEERKSGRTPFNRNEIRTLETARKYGLCGAKRKPGPDGVNKGKVCLMKAGQGTDHPGIGYCRHHGGNSSTKQKSAIKQRAILMGAPKEINAIDAIIWCIHLTAGEVEFCNEQLAALRQEDWIENTIIGKQVHLWAKERQNAVVRLMKFSRDAVQLGLNERAIRLAEQYGSSIARYTKGILQDLEPYLSDEGKRLTPGIVKRHLIILQGGDPSMGIVPEELKQERPARTFKALPAGEVIDV